MTTSSPPRLVTIPASHYCEKARWALDHAGVAYQEEGHLPFFSRVAGLRRGRAWYSVPMLVTGEGTVTDSTAILAWADERAGDGRRLLAEDARERAEALELEDRFDRVLGPHARRWGYHAMLPMKGLALRALASGVPRHEALAARALYPVLVGMIRRGLRIDDDSARRSEARVDEIFAEVGARLQGGRRYLVGDRFGAADLSFAALAAPVLLPVGYPAPLPDEASLPPAVAERIARWRATPAGQFAARLYREHRVRRERHGAS